MKSFAGMSLADLDQESSDHSSGQTKRARESSDSLSSTTNFPQKRGRHEVAHDMQGGKAKKTMAGTSTPTSYAGAVKASNQKLTITRKESEGDGAMDNMDLCEIQSAITKMILHTDLGFLVRIDCTFIFEGKVLMICKDKKTLEWAKQVVEAIVPSLVVHQSYDAKGPKKDLPLAKTFGIWLPEDDGLSISDTLTLVSRCNAKISCERRGATCSIRSGTFANYTEGTELQPIRWLSAGSVPKEEKCQAVSESGDVIAIAKG